MILLDIFSARQVMLAIEHKFGGCRGYIDIIDIAYETK